MMKYLSVRNDFLQVIPLTLKDSVLARLGECVCISQQMKIVGSFLHTIRVRYEAVIRSPTTLGEVLVRFPRFKSMPCINIENEKCEWNQMAYLSTGTINTIAYEHFRKKIVDG